MTSRTRPFTQTIPIEEARAIIEKAIKPIARVEWLQLHEAGGRVLAHDIVAGFDVPPFARAAMDGYALRAEDVATASRENPATLSCIEQVFTGSEDRPAIIATTALESTPPDRKAPSGTPDIKRMRTASRRRCSSPRRYRPASAAG